MGELINGRTAEEIKLNLKTCSESKCQMECPYYNYPIGSCAEGLARDALALIAQLEAERDAALAKVTKWISVEERLPEEDQTVLVYFDERVGVARIIGEDMFNGGPDWTYTGLGGNPTHWMPLPEPPEVNTHDA